MLVSEGGREASITVFASGEANISTLGNFMELGEGESDTVTFEYTVTDLFGEESTATTTIEVLGPPIVADASQLVFFSEVQNSGGSLYGEVAGRAGDLEDWQLTTIDSYGNPIISFKLDETFIEEQTGGFGASSTGKMEGRTFALLLLDPEGEVSGFHRLGNGDRFHIIATLEYSRPPTGTDLDENPPWPVHSAGWRGRA